MNNEHLTEMVIQQYVIDPADCDAPVYAHIHSCAQCRQKAKEYKLLFGGIKTMERPGFSAGLAAQVLAQLPAAPARRSGMIPVLMLYIIVVLPVTGLLVYLFNDYLAGLLVGIAPILIWLVTTAMLGITGFISIDAYLHFKKQMNQLNYF